jgi:hypothetical protein
MNIEFDVIHLGENCYVVNDRGRTVATISSQGYIDWLLRSPMQEGPLVKSIRKETHMCYTRGLKILLVTPTPKTRLCELSYDVEKEGTCVALRGRGRSEEDRFESETVARLSVSSDGARYEWDLRTRLTCISATSQHCKRNPQSEDWIEFNNVYPGEAGKCMAFASRKEYECTLMRDRDGVVWRFPHQHQLHYRAKIQELNFSAGTVAGFFGEETGSPVVIIEESSLEPDWAICDMYYDLHCGARPEGPLEPGESVDFRYRIKYLGGDESADLLSVARDIPISEEDRRAHNYPRLDLGFNDFTSSVNVDRPDEGNAFKTNPPQLVWDRQQGHSAKGSLRITNTVSEETVWPSMPPNQMPPGHELNISGMMKTKGVSGKGAFIRLRYHVFQWHPEPHIEWVETLESPPVDGTTNGWVPVQVPPLDIKEEHFDYLVWIDFVLDGEGKAWLTDMDLDLAPDSDEEAQRHETPQLQTVGR